MVLVVGYFAVYHSIITFTKNIRYSATKMPSTSHTGSMFSVICISLIAQQDAALDHSLFCDLLC
jgi:hypothetical protein